MKIFDQIQTDLKQAMKAKDEASVSALRFLVAQIKQKEIDQRTSPESGQLSENQVVGLIRKEIKNRRESIEAYKKGGRDDLVKKEENEAKILGKYLPQEMAAEKLDKLVQEAIKETNAKSQADFGKVMGVVMGKVKGQADGNQMATMVKKALLSSS